VGDHLLLEKRIFQPKKLTERLQLATEFASKYGLESMELLVDDPELDSQGGFDATYAAWPTRFYLIRGRELSWIAMPDENHEYDTALQNLENLVKSECA
jgi:hypothetical protein